MLTPKKRKLLLTIPTLQGGGAERVMTTLANYWASLGWELTLVTNEKEGTVPFYDLHQSIRLVQLNALSLSTLLLPLDVLKRVFRLRWLIKQTQPQVIVSFMDMNNVITLVASLGLKIPVCIAERSNPEATTISFIKKWLRDHVYALAHVIVVQTERIYQGFSERIRQRIAVIQNPIVVPKISLNYGARTIIAAGRLSEEKRFDLLIQSFSLIEKNYKDWTLVIWGEGPERSKLHSLIEAKGLANRIGLPGITKDIFHEMAQGSIFVLSSRFEGMPNALCEAMALGLSVVSTDCPTGPRDLIAPLENGILVPVDDVVILAESMKTLMDDIKLREKLGQQAAKAMKKYAIENIASLWEKTFDEVAS